MRSIRAFCHRCGADIMRDHPILLNEFSMFGEGHPLYYVDREIKLTPSERSVVWTLLKAFPDVVRRDIILDRLGFDGDCDHVIRVLISKLRHKFRDFGVRVDPITTVRDLGYRWNVPGYEMHTSGISP